ncbi:NADH-quinone oxidoreductase subunit J [Verrucomicrobiota bacterium]|nr:NADH-quinone oxidoreductase subunit J [Verrucomicrobiota bacterium]
MTPSFTILAFLVLASALAAMSLRNLVHCALCLVVTFAGIAGLFLQLNAEFVGFAQILVYVGAVMILIVFAILLTRGAEPAAPAAFTHSTWIGVALAVVAFLTIAGAVVTSVGSTPLAAAAPDVSVRAIGEKLMHDYVLPLEAIGLLLTAAMIGAVIVAMEEKRK